MKGIKKTENTTDKGNWVLGLILVIILIITIAIFRPAYQKSVDKFINLDLKVQNPAGIYSTATNPVLTKWNADAYQTLQLIFSDIAPNPSIGKVKLDFKDTENNNLYSYSSEDPAFIFKLNLPAMRTFMLYVYLNNSVQPSFMTYLKTSDYLFNFTDINGNEIPRETTDPILQITISNPDNPTSQINIIPDTTNDIEIYNLGTLNMQPYNMIYIPISSIPKLTEYKNILKSVITTDPVKKSIQEAKIQGLDNFVFKEIQARVSVIGLPASMGGAQIGIGTGITIDNMNRFESKYPNRPKVITPDIENCIKSDSTKCMLQIRNCVNDTTYKLEIRAVYQQIGTIEPNLRYTRPQHIHFKVSNAKNLTADLNETIKINDIAQKYLINREQREFIKRDQSRQDYNMTSIENDIKQLSGKIYPLLSISI